MHLLQSKRRSRATGGPQYWLQEVDNATKTYLRAEKAVPVALVTPYGATPSTFRAVWRDAKLTAEGAAEKANAQHDRIQQAGAGESIGEAIRYWYRLKSGDFERIDIEMEVRDGKFYVTPVGYKYAGRPKLQAVQKPEYPLSFNERKQSELWRKQMEHVRKNRREMWDWAAKEICRIARDYALDSGYKHVREEDLLRASGPLNVLGIKFGPYVGKGFDCQSEFQFLDYAPYTVPIEIKKASSGFKYQQRKYSEAELSRAVILCMRHDLLNVPPNVDVIELTKLCAAMDQ